MAKINGNEVRTGNVLEYKGKLWVVVRTQHVQPGKGGAYIQAEMKGLTESTKLNERFRSSEQVERVFLEQAPHQYLYKDGDNFIFMNNETYEQIPLNADFVGDAADFLQDDMQVDMCLYQDKPISVSLPDTVILEITEAEPVVKGQTASSSYKPAILENGRRVLVPPHISTGMKIVVNTGDCSYVERAK